ncbi:hypothetical protein JXQ70_16775 [bacterium]|nr:hypothetical protein [bacterium]
MLTTRCLLTFCGKNALKWPDVIGTCRTLRSSGNVCPKPLASAWGIMMLLIRAA